MLINEWQLNAEMYTKKIISWQRIHAWTQWSDGSTYMLFNISAPLVGDPLRAQHRGRSSINIQTRQPVPQPWKDERWSAALFPFTYRSYSSSSWWFCCTSFTPWSRTAHWVLWTACWTIRTRGQTMGRDSWVKVTRRMLRCSLETSNFVFF